MSAEPVAEPTRKGARIDTGELVEIGPAHPVADLFPMLAGEDLDELADSIDEQGLLHPIVLDAEHRVLDGRNRLAACELASVVPAVTFYEGADPGGYALAVNVARRHLVKGQRAMLAARASDLLQSKRSEIAESAQVSNAYLDKARIVLRYALDLVDEVVAGSRPLNGAYAEACDRKKAAEGAEMQMARLRADAPDLADLVNEERMGLAEALAAHRARVAEQERQATVATHLLCQHLVAVAQLHGGTTAEKYDPDKALPERAVTRAVLAQAAQAIREITAKWKERGLP